MGMSRNSILLFLVAGVAGFVHGAVAGAVAAATLERARFDKREDGQEDQAAEDENGEELVE